MKTQTQKGNKTVALFKNVSKYVNLKSFNSLGIVTIDYNQHHQSMCYSQESHFQYNDENK